jgi:beta-aspartyl-peptidase (threonine type)
MGLNSAVRHPRLIVHGGAWNIPDDQSAAHLAGVCRAVSSVFPDLQSGLSALDAVEQAVNLLEADETFDAGRGAFLNARGEIELDAIICDGARMDFGAVAAVQNLLHPVSLARAVMTRSEHCFLVGKGAREFAGEMGFAEVPTSTLLTAREREFYEQIKNDPTFHTRLPFEASPMGTVGAVALDQYGNLAAATSTGGTPRKRPGRVGDTAVFGAGAYADNTSGAASATGWGESILRALLSKSTCDLMPSHSAQEAATMAIQRLQQRVDGVGGIIAISPTGKYGLAHNTPKMAFAYVKKPGVIESGLTWVTGR